MGIQNNVYDVGDLARSTRMQNGLKQVFEACHDPLPARMDHLLHVLHDNETEAAALSMK
jgi:hypothetical protein